MNGGLADLRAHSLCTQAEKKCWGWNVSSQILKAWLVGLSGSEEVLARRNPALRQAGPRIGVHFGVAGRDVAREGWGFAGPNKELDPRSWIDLCHPTLGTTLPLTGRQSQGQGH